MSNYLPPFGESVAFHKKHQAAIPFEIHGYFEETVLPNGKAATRPLKMVPYGLGVDHQYTLRFQAGDVFMVDKGHKAAVPYVFKEATNLLMTAHAVCGRMIPRAAA